MAVQSYIDGLEITSIVQEGSVTHQLNQPAFATVRVPLDQVSTSWDAARLKVVVNGSLDFHGMVSHIDDQGDENTMSRVATFADPTVIFEMRPARDGVASGDPGDFTKPTFSTRNTTAPQMIQEILIQSLDDTPPADGEGPMGIALGSFATGGVNLSFNPTDVPLSIADVIAFLVETGELDVVNTPIDSGGNMGSISAHNGDYGTDRSGEVSFKFAMSTASNCRGCRRTRDYSEIINKLWIYGGPREGNKDVPQDGQHWPYNITADDPGLTDMPRLSQSQIESAISASRAAYFTRMLVRIFDNEIDAREGHRRWWQMESWLRASPKTLVHLAPERGIAPAFGVGDLIHVEAGASFGGGFSGTQRVMEYSYRWDVDGVIALGEPIGQALAGRPPLVTSADAPL